MKRLHLGAVAGFIAIVGVSLFAIGNTTDDGAPDPGTSAVQGETTRTFTDEATGFGFTYPSSMGELELNEQDVADKVIGRLTSTAESGEEYLITIRKETGFQKLSNVTSTPAPEAIIDNIDRSYPQRFPGYTPQRQQTFNFAGTNAAEVVFTYDLPNGELGKQHFMALMDSQDEAVFISFQAKASEFERLDTELFAQIRDSITI